MSKNITLANINNYINGNGRFILNKFNLIPDFIKEQVSYRLLVCKDDCGKMGKCKVCTCPLPNRAFSTTTCNAERFPDLMSEKDWELYKINNEIK